MSRAVFLEWLVSFWTRIQTRRKTSGSSSNVPTASLDGGASSKSPPKMSGISKPLPSGSVTDNGVSACRHTNFSVYGSNHFGKCSCHDCGKEVDIATAFNNLAYDLTQLREELYSAVEATRPKNEFDLGGHAASAPSQLEDDPRTIYTCSLGTECMCDWNNRKEIFECGFSIERNRS